MSCTCICLVVNDPEKAELVDLPESKLSELAANIQMLHERIVRILRLQHISPESVKAHTLSQPAEYDTGESLALIAHSWYIDRELTDREAQLVAGKLKEFLERRKLDGLCEISEVVIASANPEDLLLEKNICSAEIIREE